MKLRKCTDGEFYWFAGADMQAHLYVILGEPWYVVGELLCGATSISKTAVMSSLPRCFRCLVIAKGEGVDT